MDVQIESIDGITVVRLTGSYDSSTRGNMEIELLSLISYGSKLLFDLSEVGDISSAGLAFLLEVYERCERQGASLGLSNPSELVSDKLSNAWSAYQPEDTIPSPNEIPIYNSLEAGIEALRSRSKSASRSRSIAFEDSSGAQEEALEEEEVNFSAFYPKEVTVERWHTLLVYSYVPSALEAIRKDAHKFKEEIGEIHESKPTSTQLARGTEITIVPSCEGMTFNPERVTFQWLEDQHRAYFRLRADASMAELAANVQVTIYVGPLIVGTLKMGILFNEVTADAETVRSEEVHGQMYHQDDIFISYSHRDTEVIQNCKKAYEALGHNVLIDFETLRSGQKWNAELMNMIERADIFQLFWSENSSKSEYCRQEWQYALQLKRGEGFIRPVFWQEPIPTPPEELSDIHFDFAPFAIQS
jgi:anti-sigma B factor antagonist